MEVMPEIGQSASSLSRKRMQQIKSLLRFEVTLLKWCVQNILPVYDPSGGYNFVMADAGYSGTPLYKKLGFTKPPLHVLLINVPPGYRSWLGDLPEGVALASNVRSPVQAAHVFATDSMFLNAALSELRKELAQDGFIWVSWPKKTSRVPTDITEDMIREIALPLGFVDIKVCAVTEIWSGLKLVIRKSLRKE